VEIRRPIKVVSALESHPRARAREDGANGAETRSCIRSQVSGKAFASDGPQKLLTANCAKKGRKEESERMILLAG
jgi:hypothetical protein